jgi:uncharacterized NAD(P)/FAD-binding protein YdhS
MDNFDIAVIGSGAAATTTLIEVLAKLLEGPAPGNTLKLAIIEKHGEFWKGIPYGSRSSVNSLTITAISDFISSGKEKELFFSWLKLNQDDWVANYRAAGGFAAEVWLKKNLPLVDKSDWSAVYLPRYIFGIYMHGKMLGLLKAAEEKQLAEVTLIQAEAIDVLQRTNGYTVFFERQDTSVTALEAKKVVVAIGSAPVKTNVELDDNRGSYTYINELYEPSLDENLRRMTFALASAKKAEERNLLVIGSNASAIELMYLLDHRPDMLDGINQITCISQTGIMPYHISDTRHEEYPCKNLDEVRQAGGYDIHSLLEATKKDIGPAVQQGVIVPYVDRVISYTIELMQALDEESKKIFFGVYGPQLTRLIRRSGPAYKGSANNLIDKQKLRLIKGKFLKIEPGRDTAFLKYTSADGEEQTYPVPFKVIINCSGSNDLDDSSSRLIRNLIKRGLCEINLSGKGFLVNEDFEASPNLYVMGPLLGGNMNKRIHFWHLENVARLLYLSPYLAESLLA